MIVWIKTLFKDSLVYGIGFGVSRFLQIIVLPIIAHALSLSEYGYYSNYVIFYTIGGGLFVLGLDNSVARFLYDSEEKRYHQKIFSMAFFCLLLVSVGCAAAFSFFPSALLKVISVPVAHQAALPYVLFTIPALALNNYFLSWFKWKRERFFFLINAIGTVLFLLIPLLMVKKVLFLYIFQTIFFSQLTVALISAVLASGYIRPVFDARLFKAMLKYGFPWMLVFFIGLSRSYLDRFFLTRYLNEDLYGVYNFSVRLSTFLALLSTAFDMSFGPLAFSIWNKEGASYFFARLQSAYVLLIGLVACLIVILSPFLVNCLGGVKYAGAEKVLPFLLFSSIPLSLINFSSLGIVYAKKSFLSTITLIIGFSAVLLLNLILTPVYLQYGAVSASLIGHLLILASGYYFSARYYQIKFHYVKDGLIFLTLLFLSILFVQVRLSENLYGDVAFKIALLIAIALITTFIFFQSELKKVSVFLKKMSYARIRSNARL